MSGQQPRPGRRGFGPLDPDEAWDARVGTEADGYGAYYEENELQDRPGAAAGPYEGGSYTMNLPVTPRVQAADATSGPSLAAGGEQERGRTREREPAGLAPDAARKVNPFDDDAEPSNMSLRGISPRPLDESAGGNGKRDNSPTGRRSVFREDM